MLKNKFFIVISLIVTALFLDLNGAAEFKEDNFYQSPMLTPKKVRLKSAEARASKSGTIKLAMGKFNRYTTPKNWITNPWKKTGSCFPMPTIMQDSTPLDRSGDLTRFQTWSGASIDPEKLNAIVREENASCGAHAALTAFNAISEYQNKNNVGTTCLLFHENNTSVVRFLNQLNPLRDGILEARRKANPRAATISGNYWNSDEIRRALSSFDQMIHQNIVVIDDVMEITGNVFRNEKIDHFRQNGGDGILATIVSTKGYDHWISIVFQKVNGTTIAHVGNSLSLKAAPNKEVQRNRDKINGRLTHFIHYVKTPLTAQAATAQADA